MVENESPKCFLDDLVYILERKNILSHFVSYLKLKKKTA